MSPIDFFGASWPELCARVDDNRLLDRWAVTEPDLAGFESLEELWSFTDKRRGDAVLGALVRLAAIDGGDDTVAAQVVAHLVGGRIAYLAGTLWALAGDDIDPIVAGSLWEQIRTFPWRRRRRAFATSLVLEVRGQVQALVSPPADGVTRAVPMAPEDLCLAAAPDTTPDQQAEPALELAQLLGWARAAGVVSAAEAGLLQELAEAGAETAGQVQCAQPGASTGAAIRLVARRQGVCPRTVRRHRDEVLRRLRAARETYMGCAA